MAWGRKHGLLVAGGGLAGSLAALAMAKARPEVPLMLVGEEARFGGGRSLLLLDGELADEEMRSLVEPLIAQSWDSCYVAFPGRSRRLKLACHFIPAATLDEAVREAVRRDQQRSAARIVAVREQSLLLQGGESLAADGAVDARGAANLSMLDLAWRRAVARTYAFDAPHRVDRPVLADGTVEQESGCRFFTCIPLDERRLHVEEVRYGASAELDAEAAGRRIDDYVALRGWKGGKVEAEESEALPAPLGGDFEASWRIGGARVAKIGVRGGFSHPTLGSPLTDSARSGLLLARQRDHHGAALHDVFEAEATAQWRRREPYRAFNRELLRGGCAVLERLYALDTELIARFHSERLGLLDRRKVIAAATG